MGRQLAGVQSPGGLLHVGPWLEAGPLPQAGGKALSTTYRHSREDWVSSGGAGTLPWFTLKRQEPLSEVGKDGGPSGNWYLGGSMGSWDWRGQGLNPGYASYDRALGQSVGPL